MAVTKNHQQQWAGDPSGGREVVGAFVRIMMLNTDKNFSSGTNGHAGLAGKGKNRKWRMVILCFQIC